MACLCLHNYLLQTKNSLYTPQGFVNVELEDNKINKEKLKSQARQDGCLKLMEPLKSGRKKIVANKLQENLKHFLSSEIGSVPWHLDYVKSVGKMRGHK